MHVLLFLFRKGQEAMEAQREICAMYSAISADTSARDGLCTSVLEIWISTMLLAPVVQLLIDDDQIWLQLKLIVIWQRERLQSVLELTI